MEINNGFDQAAMPMDVIWLDIEHTDGKVCFAYCYFCLCVLQSFKFCVLQRYFTWDKTHFPNPDEMLTEVGNSGRRMVGKCLSLSLSLSLSLPSHNCR
jgi:alpha 1,3-glucosidase